MRTIIIAIAFIASSLGVHAQSQQTQSSDEQSVETAKMLEVLSTWKQWHAEPTKANAYISDFMEKHEVPQKGMKNLSREETWYWWMSHHSEEVDLFLKQKAKAEN